MRGGLLCLVLVVGLVLVPGVARAEPGVLLDLITDPASGHGLALIGDQGGPGDASAVRAQPLSAQGALVGSPSGVVDDVHSGFVDHMVVAAYDPSRRHYLVAWAGHTPDMASGPCPQPGGLGAGPPVPPGGFTCQREDAEIFVRLVDVDGVPVGAARRLSSTGPASSADDFATSPSVVRVAGGFVVAWAGAVTGDGTHAALFDERLSPAGSPAGPPRRLRLRPQATGVRPVLRLVSGPGARGALLVFTWAQRPNAWRLFAARLDDAGRAGRAREVRTGDRAVDLDDVVAANGQPGALAIWSPAVAGSHADFRARLLTPAGRPAGPVHVLPFREGTGPIAAASDLDGHGWLIAGGVRSTAGAQAQANVLHTTSDGRPRGGLHRVSSGSVPVENPFAAPLARGHVIGWSLPAWGMPPAPPALRLITIR